MMKITQFCTESKAIFFKGNIVITSEDFLVLVCSFSEESSPSYEGVCIGTLDNKNYENVLGNYSSNRSKEGCTQFKGIIRTNIEDE